MFPPRLTQRLRAALLLAATTALLLVTAVACSPSIGDSCETSQQCNTGAICDTTAPDGYCTQTPCTANSCPDEAACVEFDNDATYCMLRCESDGDCRDGYTCRTDRGPLAFCYIE